MNIGAFAKRQISVARVYGIPVRIDYRWFLVFALVVWLIVSNLRHGSASLPAHNLTAALLLGVVNTLALVKGIPV